VAEGTRSTFERLCLLHAYGVLSFDMFTAADDLAQLVIEQALRDRFGGSTMASCRLRTRLAQCTRFQRPRSMRCSKRSTPRVGSEAAALAAPLYRTGELIYFDGMLDSCCGGPQRGSDPGQRNRQLESVLRKLRSHVAHGGGYQLVMPVDSARTISDAAEIINHLWGSSTPGGRLYPAPIHREIQTVHGALAVR